MVTLKRENRIVKVDESALDRYLAKGYVKVEVEQPAPPKPAYKNEPKKPEPQIFEPAFREDVKSSVKSTRAKRNKK
jgi:hypothetical protein